MNNKNDGGAKGNLQNILRKLDEFGLPITKRASYELELVCKEIFKDKDDDYRLSEEDTRKIRDKANILRPTLDAESSGLFAYVISEQRYQSKYLLENPWKLFAHGVRDRLDDIAISDIEEAAKCIAFQRFTAAAFHLMRATESTLKEFYCQAVKRNRCSLMWGPMVSALRTKRNPPDAALLDHLDNIRRNCRNPTQHPEKRYEATEAQDLFGVCIDVINRMSALMPLRSSVEKG